MFEYTPLSTILNKQVKKIKKGKFRSQQNVSQKATKISEILISGYNDQVVNEKVMVCSNVKLNL